MVDYLTYTLWLQRAEQIQQELEFNRVAQDRLNERRTEFRTAKSAVGAMAEFFRADVRHGPCRTR